MIFLVVTFWETGALYFNSYDNEHMSRLRDFAKIEDLPEIWFNLLWVRGELSTQKELAKKSEIPTKIFTEILADDELLHSWSGKRDRLASDINLAIKSTDSSLILYNLAEQSNLDKLGLKLLIKKADNPVAQALLKRKDIPDRARHNLIAKFIHSVGDKFNFSVSYYQGEGVRKLPALFGNKPEYFVTAVSNASWYHSVVLVEASALFSDQDEVVKALLKKIESEPIEKELWSLVEFNNDLNTMLCNLVNNCELTLEELKLINLLAKQVQGEAKMLVERNIKFTNLLLDFKLEVCLENDIIHQQKLENLISLSSKSPINAHKLKEIVEEVARHSTILEFDSLFYWTRRVPEEIVTQLLNCLLTFKNNKVILELLKAGTIPTLEFEQREQVIRILIENQEHKVLKARLKPEEFSRYILTLSPLTAYLDKEIVVKEVFKVIKDLPPQELETVLSLLPSWESDLRSLLETIRYI